MNQPFCLGCRKVMSVATNGVHVAFRDFDGNPYELRNGDLYFCSDCGHQIVAGWGAPMYHHDPAFDDKLTALRKSGLLYEEQP